MTFNLCCCDTDHIKFVSQYTESMGYNSIACLGHIDAFGQRAQRLGGQASEGPGPPLLVCASCLLRPRRVTEARGREGGARRAWVWCGSRFFGPSCLCRSSRPHTHDNQGASCLWCDSSYGAGCLDAPTKTPAHGSGADGMWCGARVYGVGCRHSPQGCMNTNPNARLTNMLCNRSSFSQP